MRSTLAVIFVCLTTLPAFADEPVVKETLFHRRCREQAAMSSVAQQIIANQRLQLREAQVSNELLLRQLEIQARMEGMLIARAGMPYGGQQGPSAQINPAYNVPAPTTPYNVPGPTTPYAVPAPTTPYSVPGPTTPYAAPAPSSPYSVPGPSYEFRLQSPTGIPAPGGGMSVPPPSGVTPLQPVPAPTSRAVAWSNVRNYRR